jgi:hypothetical protein
MDMVRAALTGDQAGELEWNPGQSRSGDRRHGYRSVGGGGCERHDAHLRRLRRSKCPGGPDNSLPHRKCSGDPDERGDLLEESRGRADRLQIRRCQAIPDRHPALGLYADPGPIGAVAHGRDLARALAFDVIFVPAVEIARALAFCVTLTFAFAYRVLVPLVIQVADSGLRPIG